jgi:hypothetical protein
VGPYRANTHEEVVAPGRRRDGKTFAALPLGVIAATFTMPFTSSCSGTTISPESACRGTATLWIGPTFFAAALLCAALIHTALTRKYANWLTLAAGAISAACAAMLSIIAIGDVVNKPFAIVWGLPAMAAVTLFVLICKSRGSRRLGLALDTYVLSSLPFAVLATMTAERYGAYLFSTAFVVLLLSRAVAFIARVTKTKRRGRSLVHASFVASRGGY